VSRTATPPSWTAIVTRPDAALSDDDTTTSASAAAAPDSTRAPPADERSAFSARVGDRGAAHGEVEVEAGERDDARGEGALPRVAEAAIDVRDGEP
jgi:hypothetical protein